MWGEREKSGNAKLGPSPWRGGCAPGMLWRVGLRDRGMNGGALQGVCRSFYTSRRVVGNPSPSWKIHSTLLFGA